MIQLQPRSIPRQLAVTLALALGCALLPLATAQASERASLEPRRLQRLVDRMRAQMKVPEKVEVTLVATNPLKASVEPVKGAPSRYRLSIERAFLAQLNAEELKAVIAHELGHVWIYTHHPYLQTEQLANQIALKVTSRETLVKVYSKVWAETGAGTLPRFPEQPQTAAGLGERPLK